MGHGLTLALAVCAGVLAARAETINVLSLGAKNDGSADVSAIVNANTAKGALLFPAGIYKVAHPLVLKNPIRGEGHAHVARLGDRLHERGAGRDRVRRRQPD